MKLKEHIDKKYNGSSTAFARAYTQALVDERVLFPPKRIHRQQVDRWIADDADWFKSRVSMTKVKP